MRRNQTSLESFFSEGGKKRTNDNDNEETAAGKEKGKIKPLLTENMTIHL